MNFQEKIKSMNKYGVSSVPDSDILNSSELMAHACTIYPGYISKIFKNDENIVVPPKKIIKLLCLISKSFSLETYKSLPLEYQVNLEVLCKVLAHDNFNPQKSEIITNLEPSLYKNVKFIKFLLKDKNSHLDMFDLSRLSDKEIITEATDVFIVLDHFQESILENNRIDILLEFNPQALGLLNNEILLGLYKQKPDFLKKTLSNAKNKTLSFSLLPHEILSDEDFFQNISFSLVNLSFLHPSYSQNIDFLKNNFSVTQIAHYKGLPFEIRHHPEIQELILQQFATITDTNNAGFICDERLVSLRKIQQADSLSSVIDGFIECDKFLNMGVINHEFVSGKCHRLVGLINSDLLNDKDFVMSLLDIVSPLENYSNFIWSELPLHLKTDRDIFDKMILSFPDLLHSYLNDFLAHMRNDESIFSEKNQIVIDMIELFNAHPPVSSTIFSGYSADFVSGFLWFKDIEKVFEKIDMPESQAKATVLDMLEFFKGIPIVKEDFLMTKSLESSDTLLPQKNYTKPRKF